MKNFFRMTALAVLALVLFAGCKQDMGDEKESLPAGVSRLEADDPICGTFSGNFGKSIYSQKLSVHTAASATKIDQKESGCSTFSQFDWDKSDFKDDANPTYVVYNKYSDGTGIDKHSGVIIFQAKYSPWGSPAVGCYYGVKFQFLESGKKIPETRSASTVYTDDIYIEGGYNAAYNNVSTLEDAVKKFGFDNTAYFNPSFWNWEKSGASKQ